MRCATTNLLRRDQARNLRLCNRWSVHTLGRLHLNTSRWCSTSKRKAPADSDICPTLPPTTQPRPGMPFSGFCCLLGKSRFSHRTACRSTIVAKRVSKKRPSRLCSAYPSPRERPLFVRRHRPYLRPVADGVPCASSDELPRRKHAIRSAKPANGMNPAHGREAPRAPSTRPPPRLFTSPIKAPGWRRVAGTRCVFRQPPMLKRSAPLRALLPADSHFGVGELPASSP